MKNKERFNSVFAIILLFELFSISGYAQTQQKYFEKTVSGYLSINANSVLNDSDTSYIIGGRLHLNNSFNTFKSYFARVSCYGELSTINILESDTVVGDFGISDFIKTDYGFVLTGNLSTNDSDDTIYAMIAKTNDIFSIQGLQKIVSESNEDMGYSLTQNMAGEIFIGGYYKPPFLTPSRDKLYLTKLASNGDKLWEYKNWTYPYNCAFRAVLPAADGGCYAAGYVNVYGSSLGDIIFIKLSATGNVVWQKVYSFNTGNGGASASGLAATYDNGFVLCGSSNYGHARLLKTDAAGDSIWSREYFPNEQISTFLKVAALPDNNIVAIGSVKSYGVSGIDMLITKVDSSCNLLWHRRYGSPDVHDYGYDFTPTIEPKGGFVVVGRTDTIAMVSGQNWSLGRGYIVKTNCMGLLTQPQAAYTVAQDPAFPGRFLFTNQSQYAYPDSIDGGYYVWQWGDASPPYICGQGYAPCPPDAQPLAHTYQTTGIYPVTLQAIVCNDTSTLTRAVCLGVEPNPQAQFTYNDFGGAVQFTNLSQNAYFAQGGYCVWDFGDGSPTTTQLNPTHTYTENGNYPVTLTVVVCQDTSVYMQFVQVQTVGVSPPFFEGGQGGQQVVVYPNPAQNLLHFTLQNPLTPPAGWSVSLFTPAGHRVLHNTVSPASATASVEIGHLPVGMYFYTVQSGGVVLARGKVAVVR